MAIGLDRSHAGAVSGVSVAANNKVKLTVVAEPGADVSLELYSARERASMLEEMTGREVVVDV